MSRPDHACCIDPSDIHTPGVWLAPPIFGCERSILSTQRGRTVQLGSVFQLDVVSAELSRNDGQRLAALATFFRCRSGAIEVFPAFTDEVGKHSEIRLDCCMYERTSSRILLLVSSPTQPQSGALHVHYLCTLPGGSLHTKCLPLNRPGSCATGPWQ